MTEPTQPTDSHKSDDVQPDKPVQPVTPAPTHRTDNAGLEPANPYASVRDSLGNPVAPIPAQISPSRAITGPSPVVDTTEPKQQSVVPRATATSPVGYVVRFRPRTVTYWLALTGKLFIGIFAIMFILTGIDLVKPLGFTSPVVTGSWFLAIGLLLPIFYSAIVSERDRQLFVKTLAKSQHASISYRSKDSQAIVSDTAGITYPRSKPKWAPWIIVSALFVIFGGYLLVSGLSVENVFIDTTVV